MEELFPGLVDRLTMIRERISHAQHRSEHGAKSVRLVAVTKTLGPGAVRAAVAVGIDAVGENKVQELSEKRAAVGDGTKVSWELIGHLQRNKARAAVECADRIQSVDSDRLAERLVALRSEISVPPVLIQVNTSGEATKGGFEWNDHGLFDRLVRFHNDGLVIQGWMTMAPLVEDEAAIRTAFRRLRELRDRFVMMNPAIPALELSMGMSHDYELAVEEGATIVRIGTLLFGSRS